MAAVQVIGFVTVNEAGDVFVRSGSQLAELMLRGYDPTDVMNCLAYYGFVTRRFDTISEIDAAMDCAEERFWSRAGEL